MLHDGLVAMRVPAPRLRRLDKLAVDLLVVVAVPEHLALAAHVAALGFDVGARDEGVGGVVAEHRLPVPEVVCADDASVRVRFGAGEERFEPAGAEPEVVGAGEVEAVAARLRDFEAGVVLPREVARPGLERHHHHGVRGLAEVEARFDLVVVEERREEQHLRAGRRRADALDERRRVLRPPEDRDADQERSHAAALAFAAQYLRRRASFDAKRHTSQRQRFSLNARSPCSCRGCASPRSKPRFRLARSAFWASMQSRQRHPSAR